MADDGVAPQVGVVDVLIVGRDVVVAAQEQRFVRREVALQMIGKAPQPAQLVAYLSESMLCPFGT